MYENMRFVISFLLIVSFSVSLSAQGGTWTWIHGDSTSALSTGSYGVQGVPSATNAPPGRYHPAYWQDLQGNFWIFGGNNRADLWKYDVTTNIWTWMSGTAATNSVGSYGVKGIPSVSNFPAYRNFGCACWVDSIGDLWLFGGSGAKGLLNDLWRYNITNNEWTWVGGDNPNVGFTTPRNCGTKYVTAPTNFPGQRWECKSNWVVNNELVFFGGGATGGNRSDLWTYSIANNLWKWIGGDTVTNSVGSFGTKGLASATNSPPARWSYTKWRDKDKLYIFAGTGTGARNDVWSFNLTTGLWTWEQGPNTTSDPGLNPPANCIDSNIYYPSARYENHTIQTSICNKSFWSFGGAGGLCDLWLFKVDHNSWIKVSGLSSTGCVGRYGLKGVPSISNHPKGRHGMAIWNDAKYNLYIFGGNIGTNDLWKFVPDSTCFKLSLLKGNSLILPGDKSICSPGDTVVVDLDTALHHVTWSPNSSVRVNADTSRLKFFPSVKTRFRITAMGGICSSTDTVEFDVLIGVNKYDTITRRICEGTNYYGYNSSGKYDYKLSMSSGCDSNIHLTLLVDKKDTTDITQSICNGDTVHFNGLKITQFGLYKDTLTNKNGCDSLIRLTILLKSRDTIKQFDTICDGSFIIFNADTIMSTGIYWDTLPNAGGCDTFVQLNLYQRDPIYYNLYSTLCIGSSYVFKGQTLVTPGQYWDTLMSVLGCDSFVILNLYFINLNDTMRIKDSICINSSYNFYGSMLDTAGIYYKKFSNINRCDSFVELSLKVMTDTTVKLDSLCRNTGSISFNGTTITTDGIYWDTLTNVKGCDSFIKLNVSFYIDTFLIGDSICKNAGYIYGLDTLRVSGTYTYRYLSITRGCDSIVKLTLEYFQVDTAFLRDSICRNGFMQFNTILLNTPGIYWDTLKSIKGCDSFVRLNLTLNADTNSKFITQHLCQDSFYIFGTDTLRTSGTYKDTQVNSIGCDSFIYLNLIYTPKDITYDSATICRGNSYHFHSRILTDSGIYTYRMNNKYYCDSTIVFKLKVKELDSVDSSHHICYGDSIFFHNAWRKTGGYYLDTLKYANGCDSLVIQFRLTVSPNKSLDTTVHEGCHSVVYNSVTYSTNTTIVEKLLTAKSCDSFWHVHEIRIKPSPQLNPSVKYIFCDSIRINGKKYTQSKDIMDTIRTKDILKCDSIYTPMTLVQYSTPILDIALSPKRDIYWKGDVIEMKASNARYYLWNTEDSTKIINSKILVDSIQFYVIGWDTILCRDTAYVLIRTKDSSVARVPDAFSPNGDGVNDILYLRTVGIEKLLSFKIYNRLGQLLFSAMDLNDGWDGYYKTVLQASEVYYYTFQALSFGGKKESGEGNFLLLR